MLKYLFFGCLIGFFPWYGSLAAESKVLVLDSQHSSIVFSIKPIGLKDVYGQFERYRGQCKIDGTIISEMRVTINIASIDTNNKTRDRHLMQKEFFNEKKFPVMVFIQSDPLDMTDKMLKGELSIKGIRQAIELPVTLNYKLEDQEIIVEGHAEDFTLNRVNYGVDAQKRLISHFVKPQLHVRCVSK